MTHDGMPLRSVIARALILASLAACAGRVPPSPMPSPAAPDAPVATPVRVVRRTALPARIASTSWTVTSSARIRVNDSAEDQRIDTRARVSWGFERQSTGALRGSGQIDGYAVRSSLDSARAGTGSPASLILLDAVLDSTMIRVVTRPPQVNECDRVETSAAALARELLVRVPDGLVAGDQWKDSTVSLVCRSGVPIAVYTTVRSRVDRLTDELVVVQREVSSTLDGKGGSAFRGLEITGTGVGSQRVEISALRGTVERLEGTSTLTLRVTERLPTAPARTQQVVQRVELRAERIAR